MHLKAESRWVYTLKHKKYRTHFLFTHFLFKIEIAAINDTRYWELYKRVIFLAWQTSKYFVGETFSDNINIFY